MMLAAGYANCRTLNALESIQSVNPRPGLRRWVAPTTVVDKRDRWREAWASVHDDGSVALASAIGGRTRRDADLGNEVDAERSEIFVAEFMALLRAAAEYHGTGDYEVRVGIDWQGSERLLIVTVDELGWPLQAGSIPLERVPWITRVECGRSPLCLIAMT
jgi:hypothetical protein